jgi:hypothetical protein
LNATCWVRSGTQHSTRIPRRLNGYACAAIAQHASCASITGPSVMHAPEKAHLNPNSRGSPPPAKLIRYVLKY